MELEPELEGRSRGLGWRARLGGGAFAGRLVEVSWVEVCASASASGDGVSSG